MIGIHKLLLVFGLTILLPWTAFAAGSASIQSDGETSKIIWQDENTMRMETPNEADYMLIRDGKAYMVSNPESGEPEVVEVGGMMQAFVQMAESMGEGQAIPEEVGRAEATGEGATVAGIAGEVYEVQITNKNGEVETLTVVLTDDPLAVEMTAAYLGFARAIVGPDLVQKLVTALPDEKRGVLRVKGQMEVQSIADAQPDAALFELPAKPMSMSDLLQGLGQQAE